VYCVLCCAVLYRVMYHHLALCMWRMLLVLDGVGLRVLFVRLLLGFALAPALAVSRLCFLCAPMRRLAARHPAVVRCVPPKPSLPTVVLPSLAPRHSLHSTSLCHLALSSTLPDPRHLLPNLAPLCGDLCPRQAHGAHGHSVEARAAAVASCTALPHTSCPQPFFLCLGCLGSHCP